MLCQMSLGRSLATVVYVGATLAWGWDDGAQRVLLCDGGCTANE
jgi:hypothetical protein